MTTRIVLVACMGVLLAGCFDNMSAPTDAVTVTSLEQLAATNRAAVQRLILRGNGKTVSAADLAGMPVLETLDLSENALAEVPEAVYAQKNLEEFYFARNALAKVPVRLGELANLDYINLDDNKLESAEGLGQFPKLMWLRLNGNALKEIPASLGTLKHLQRFYASRNQIKEIGEAVRQWTELEDLVLDGNPISTVPEWLVDLPKLKGVSLNGTRVTKLPADLGKWRKLDYLSLGGCAFPADEMKRIRAALPDVAIVF